MSNQNASKPTMPTGGVFTLGNAQGKKDESSVIKYGSDLRDGSGKK